LVFKFQNARTAKFPRICFFVSVSYIFPFKVAGETKTYSYCNSKQASETSICSREIRKIQLLRRYLWGSSQWNQKTRKM